MIEDPKGPSPVESPLNDSKPEQLTSEKPHETRGNWLVRMEQAAQNRPFAAIVALVTIMLTVIGIYVAYLGQTSLAKRRECEYDLEICMSRTSEQVTVEVTRIVTKEVFVEVTPIPRSPTFTPNSIHTKTPTLAPAEILNGTCDKVDPPCLYYNPLSWPALAEFLYGEAETFRWPEIANLNRRPDGTLEIPLQRSEWPIFLPAAVSQGTYRPMVRLGNGRFEYIPDCEEGGEKPCVYTVGTDFVGNDLSAFQGIAGEVYGNDAAIYGKKIAQANFASEQKLVSVTLSPGVRIVIPK